MPITPTQKKLQHYKAAALFGKPFQVFHRPPLVDGYLITVDVCELYDIYKKRGEMSGQKAWWTRCARRIHRILDRHGLEHFWLRLSKTELETLRRARET